MEGQDAALTDPRTGMLLNSPQYKKYLGYIAADYTHEEAVAWATGASKTSRDPLSGQLAHVRQKEGFATSITPRLPPSPIPERDPDDKTLIEQADAAYGLGPSLSRLYANTFGQFWPGTINEEAIIARGAFIVGIKDLQRAYANNKRFPIKEMELLENLLQAPNWYTSAATIKAALKNLRTATRRKIKEARIDAQYGANDEIIGRGHTQAKDLERFLQLIGDPDEDIPKVGLTPAQRGTLEKLPPKRASPR